jgi:Mce-associated membrane protein
MNASRAESSRYAVIDKKPDPAEPDTADKSDAAEPDTADKSDAAEPDTADKSDAAEPDTADKSDAAEPDTADKSDAAEPDTADKSDAAEPDTADEPKKKSARRRVTVSLRSLVIAAVIVAVVFVVAGLGWLYVGAQRKLDAQARQLQDSAHAEKIALDYAVNAAAMNYQDINAWKAKLTAGTTPELSDKLTKAATSIQQILDPLQWTSTAKPLAAKVHSHSGATYVVDAFVSVMTKTVQAPDPLQSTATYSVTLDGSNDWKITDVGGVGAAVEEK